MTGHELSYIKDAVNLGHISGNGEYTKWCQAYFESSLKCKKALMTTSCTDALEMCALLLDIEPGDEVIVPSYTFVSTALAFVRQGAKIVFADSCNEHPCIDVTKIESLITDKTKAIVPVHYAGVACDMDVIMSLAEKYGIFVVEDAAQAIDSFYKGRPLGSIGHLSTFSFHETKNIQCGEGGMLVINDNRFVSRAEILWEKGTNRAEFFRGEVNKYGWVDIGSSFLPSELNAAFLRSQLEHLNTIQKRRKEICRYYRNGLQRLVDDNQLNISSIPDYATDNGHMFFIVCKDLDERTRLIKFLKENDVHAVFHYLSLHSSKYIEVKQQCVTDLCKMSDHYTNCLLRLPLYFEMSDAEVQYVIKTIMSFYE